MAYKALYREFRPRRFSDLKGQEVISAVLRNQVRQESPAHAYIFSGPRGTGKTSAAKILAAALNCLDRQDGEPCLLCENCKAALQGAMIDILELDAASNNGVENVRDIVDRAELLPVGGRYKVYIIDEVHMLSPAAFNALLKTLEEPPSHVVFILATTNIEALPKTVLSRCQRFDFKFLDEKNVMLRMEEILEAVGVPAEPEALRLIAKASEGAMRDALTILEKCIALQENVTEELVLEVLGYGDKATMVSLMDALARYDTRLAIETLLFVLAAGVEPGILCAQLIQMGEDMLVLAVKKDYESEYGRIAERFSVAGLVRLIDSLANSEYLIKKASRPTAVLEAAILRALLPEAEKEQTLIEHDARLRKLENQPAQHIALAEKPKEKKAEQRQATPSGNENAEAWAWLLKEYKNDISLKPMLSGLEPVELGGGTIRLRAASPMIRMMFESTGFRAEAEQKLEQQFLRRISLETVEKNEEKLNGQEKIDIID